MTTKVLPEWKPEDIRLLRLHCGMTQRDLADELAVRQATICDWETGKYRPRRFIRLVLTNLAERARFDMKGLN